MFEWFKALLSGPPKAQPDVSPFQPGTGPACLLVLRHAEKTGDKRDRGLSPAGHERAARLVPYILESFGRPEFLVAAKSSERSRRPVETLEPLAAALGLDIKSKFDDSEVDGLVVALAEKQSFQGTFGVISWRHSNLPHLVEALGAPAHALPNGWQESDYTTVIALTYGAVGTVTVDRLEMPF